MIAQLLTSGVVGAVGGFVMQYAAEKARVEAEREQRQLDAILRLAKVEDQSHDAAAKRQIDGGKVNRRIILVALLFGVVLMPALAPLFGLTIYVREEWATPEWLFGLIPSMKKWEYVPLTGYYTHAVLLDGVAALIGFHFGAAAGRRKG